MTPRSSQTRFFRAAVALILLAGWAAYHNIFSAPFVFDDLPAIVENPSIRHLWPLTSLHPPAGGSGVSGRPLVNISLAVNYALGGLHPWGYHLFNLAIHLLAAAVLFGVVRRTLAGRGLEPAGALALSATLIWVLHPLLTESVTCSVQRTESLMGLFYLLTLYGFLRYAAAGSWFWGGVSVLACLLGMATKEAMVTAPVMVGLYDRTFLAGSFRAAWRRRRAYYAGLAATWLLLAFLVLSGGGSRGRAAGFGLGVTPGHYLLTQAWAIPHYLRLAVWPYPLVLDYGTYVATWAEAWLPGLFVCALLAATAWLLFQPAAQASRRALGFCGAWFFLILAPSSSVVPLVAQTVAEHRMYLPLAALIVLGVGAAYRGLGRSGLIASLAVASGCGVLTLARNADYLSAKAIWSDTVKHWPKNGRAYGGLGLALAAENRVPEAIACYRTGLQLSPGDADLESDLGCAYRLEGNPPEAIAAFHRAIRLRPDFAEAYNNLGDAQLAGRDPAAAVASLRTAVKIAPDFAEAHYNLGIALAAAGRPAEAAMAYARAVALNPGYAEANYNWGNVLVALGRPDEAAARFARAVRIQPEYAEAENNWGNVLRSQGRSAAAIDHFRRASELRPDSAEFHFNWANALADAGRWDDARAHYDAAARLRLDLPQARFNFGLALAKAGRLPAAAEQLRRAIALQPDWAVAHEDLGRILRALGESEAGAAELQRAEHLRRKAAP